MKYRGTSTFFFYKKGESPFGFSTVKSKEGICSLNGLWTPLVVTVCKPLLDDRPTYSFPFGNSLSSWFTTKQFAE